MKIKLIDFDGKIPNLALMKLSAFHKRLDCNEVGFDIEDPDLVFVSCLFEKNRKEALKLKDKYDQIVVAGPGISNHTLPDVIEDFKPDYDLYPSSYSQGYTTRGCVNDCKFCQVRQKEGEFRRHQSVEQFYDDRFDTVMLMDNNILADTDWFMYNTDFILDHGLKVLEHGMAIDLLSEETANRLAELKFPAYMHFAFDFMAMEKDVLRGIDMLKDAGINVRQKVQFYVLTGYDTTLEEDKYRCNLLRENKTNAYVMRYDFKRDDKKQNALARWANSPQIFWKTEFKDYTRKKS
jgi:hypothetical protein